MRRLICTFVVRIWHKTHFRMTGPIWQQQLRHCDTSNWVIKIKTKRKLKSPLSVFAKKYIILLYTLLKMFKGKPNVFSISNGATVSSKWNDFFVWLFHSFWAEPIIRLGENGRSLRKTTWPPASRTWLDSLVTQARLKPTAVRWQAILRALKFSILNNSAMGAANGRITHFDWQMFITVSRIVFSEKSIYFPHPPLSCSRCDDWMTDEETTLAKSTRFCDLENRVKVSKI